MYESVIPNYDDIDQLTADERKEIMVVRSGKSEDAPIELMLRNIFVWAIISGSSDVHIGARGDRQKPRIYISVRSPKGLVNLQYDGSQGRHFETKMFALTATPQGGSTPDIVSTRFAIRLPSHYARKHGLEAFDDRPYLVSIRVEYIKTFDGYKFVCRLLDQQKAPKLEELGMSYALLQTVERVLQESSGLILVTGPTGSGKTTLLNALIARLNTGQRAIVTIENPVEFILEGEGPITQIPVGGDITFAKALRSILRQDPDVILVGEIRDTETMEIALQAAQTGHLVLATLHANSAPETFSRALDLTGDKRRDGFRLAEAVKLVLAQRLVDRYAGAPGDRELMRDESDWLCLNGLGHFTRVREPDSISKIGKAALIEAITMIPTIKDVLRAEGLNASDIYRLAKDQLQYETLASAGVRAVQGLGCKLKDCMTSLDSTTDAESNPGLRSRLARDHGLTLVQVSDAIDAYCRGLDERRLEPLDFYIEQVRSVA